MTKLRYYLLALVALIAFAGAEAQTYATLWKQHSEAKAADLPKRQLDVLRQIASKAEAGRDYGQLYKALMLQAQTLGDISPDSLRPALERLTARKDRTTDSVARAVLAAALYNIHNDTYRQHSSDSLRLQLRQEAMAPASLLAQTSQSGYEPFVVSGSECRTVFGGDMLSVIGYEVEDYAAMHSEYVRRANRPAACITALEMLRRGPATRTAYRLSTSPYLVSLDSLAEIYGDLPACGEVAITRYKYMSECRDVSAGDKIAYIHRALSRWGAWPPMNELRAAEKQLTQKRFSVWAETNTVASGRTQTLYLRDIRAIDRVQLRIDGRKVVATTSFDGRPDYQLFNDSITIPALPVGKHTLELTAPGINTPAKLDYYVSDLYILAIGLPDDKTRIVVVDRTTGRPVPEAGIKLTPYQKDKATRTLYTDKNGEIVCTAAQLRGCSVQPFTARDNCCPDSRLYTNLSYSTDGATGDKLEIFTDRRIYRPGQTVHVAVVSYRQTGDAEYSTNENKPVEIILRDANYKEAARKTVATDAYGHASCDFLLPTATLTGTFTLDAGRLARQSIRVEQYKRPTFRVEMPPVEDHYSMGDTLNLEGMAKSFAGQPVPGARVGYTVSRRAGMRWNSFGSLRMQSEIIYQAEAATAADGRFRVSVPLTVEKGYERQLFAFDVDVDVTDLGGETQHASATIPLGGRAVMLTSDIVEQQLADSLRKITFRLYNTAGIDIDATVSYSIDGGATRQTPTRMAVEVESLASGVHTLLATCEGDTLRQEFTVFRETDTHPCRTTRQWMWQSSQDFPADGRPVTVQVGCSDKDTYIYYSYISGGKLLDSGVHHLSDSLLNTRWTYSDDYKDGLLLCYAWVKDGHRYGTQRISLRRPLADKRLRMRWTTFRDRLTPGSRETWTLHIDDPKGGKADAAVIATVYDKSLDMLAGHRWSLDVWQRRGTTFGGWISPTARQLNDETEALLALPKVSIFRPACFDNSLFPYLFAKEVYSGRHYMRAAGVNILSAKSTMSDTAEAMTDTKSADAAPEVLVEEADAAALHARADESATETFTRERLEETAAFFPALTTDADGNVALSFTLPESVTTWRCMAVANNRQMDCGAIDGEAVASKDVMIQPNVPRFLREGDATTLLARLTNTTHRAIAGTACLEMIDPATDKVVFTHSQPVTLAADTTQSVGFAYTAASADCLLICRMTIKGDGFSDGEQHYLPILPGRERITVAKPLAQTGKGRLTVDLKSLATDPTATYTIEYAANPAWLAVQALPALGTPRNDNAASLATALYADVLGKFIADNNPQLGRLAEADKADASTLQSALQKNDELRDIALDETPWVAEAQSEADQKARLAEFFDTNSLALRTEQTAKRLAELQRQDGAWSWWKGMDASLYITLNNTLLLARLQKLTATQAYDDMLTRAISWLDNEMTEQVERWKAEEKKGHKVHTDTETATDFLYIYGITGRKATATTDYILARMSPTPADILRKAKMAAIQAWAGKKSLAVQTVQSLVEFSVYRPEMGRYYDTRRAAYSWRSYQIPTVVAAIEAIRDITPADKTTVQQMCQWLVAQKHSQLWTDDITSAEAVYALMRTSPVAAAEPARLTIDGKAVETKPTAGMGYQKTTAPATARKLTIEQKAATTGIGAVYAQYMGRATQNTDCGELSVSREVVGDMRIGGRVTVRITIDARRDLDFVEVADRRAACMESRTCLSHYSGGAYCTPKDNATYYYFDKLRKGRHVLETEYYIDRSGTFSSGSCRVQCAYAPEFTATAAAGEITINK